MSQTTAKEKSGKVWQRTKHALKLRKDIN
uniref:Uncharacterized protein n=1 Tax=Arundo donax TaxID=35708 RepID=A0A0A8ZWY8_ARUDO